MSEIIKDLKTLHRTYGPKDFIEVDVGNALNSFRGYFNPNFRGIPSWKKETVVKLVQLMNEHYANALAKGDKISEDVSEAFKNTAGVYADLKAIYALSALLMKINERDTRKVLSLHRRLSVFMEEANELMETVVDRLSESSNGTLENDEIKNHMRFSKAKELEKDIGMLDEKLDKDMEITRGAYKVLKQVIDALKSSYKEALANAVYAYDLSESGDLAALLYTVEAYANFKAMASLYALLNGQGYSCKALEDDLRSVLQDAQAIFTMTVDLKKDL
ncbi:MAG: hypothetical protein QW750_06300 [Zestosphaera sp.]